MEDKLIQGKQFSFSKRNINVICNCLNLNPVLIRKVNCYRESFRTCLCLPKILFQAPILVVYRFVNLRYAAFKNSDWFKFLINQSERIHE